MGSEVRRIEVQDGAVCGVTLTDGRTLEASNVVCAAGNGAPHLAASVGDVVLSYPVRGIVAEVNLSRCAPALTVNLVDDTRKVTCAHLMHAVRQSLSL